MPNTMCNEQLCIAALGGDMAAKNALVENNLRFIKRTAYELWSAQRELNTALGIEIDDLVQEGSLGLLDCIAGFKPETGNKFLTYAAPAIRNAMLDYSRRWNPTFEAKHLDNLVRLDDVGKEETTGRHDFIADSRLQNPEQIYIARETHEEIHTALQRISQRDRTYLWYRFGFEDDREHPLNETAEHFHLSESRAKYTETLALDNVWLELPWWYERNFFLCQG
jgi:RNA polymerase primary sigma factor/RNA polymerase sporulation-specific sigma factor